MDQYAEYLPWIALLTGILARMIGPYLIELYIANQDGETLDWNWKYLRGQAILTIVVLMVLPYLMPVLAKVGDMTLQQAWGEGFAAAAVGRELDKLAEIFAPKLVGLIKGIVRK